MGSVGCAILPALHRLGYRDVHGIDLDPQVLRMAARRRRSTTARRHDGDQLSTTGASPPSRRSASSSTASSASALLREVARLLRPGGLFFFSTDYWPDKIDTAERPAVRPVAGRSSAPTEIERFVSQARKVGLEPTSAAYARGLRDVGERPISYRASSTRSSPVRLVRGLGGCKAMVRPSRSTSGTR